MADGHMRWLLVAIITVTAILSTGCAQEQIGGEELKEQMNSSLEEIDSYKFDMKAESKTELTKYGKRAGLESITTGKGLVDRESKNMKLEMTTTMGVSGRSSTVGSRAKMYCLNDSLYMKTSIGISEVPSNWLKMEMSEERWSAQNQLNEYFVLLNRSELKVLGSEKVNGTECYAVKVVPHNGTLWEMMVNEPAMSKQMQEINRNEVEIKNASAKFWVAKDTNFPMRTETTMELKMDSGALNMSTQEDLTVTLDLAVEVNYYSYNEPVSISLPQEAKDAVSAPQKLNQLG